MIGGKRVAVVDRNEPGKWSIEKLFADSRTKTDWKNDAKSRDDRFSNSPNNEYGASGTPVRRYPLKWTIDLNRLTCRLFRL